MSLGAPEILVILLVALLVFGPTRLPEVGRQVGKGIRELRKFQHSISSDLEDAIGRDDAPASPPPSAPTSPLPPMLPPLPDSTDGSVIDVPGGEAPGVPTDQPVAPPPPEAT